MNLKWKFAEDKSLTYWGLMEMSDSSKPDEIFQAVERFQFTGALGGQAIIDVGAVYLEHEFDWERARTIFNKFPPLPAAQFEITPKGKLSATGVSDIAMQMFWMVGLLFPEFGESIEEGDTWELPVYAQVGAPLPVEQTLQMTLIDVENSTGSARAHLHSHLLLLPGQREGAEFETDDEQIKIKWNGFGRSVFDLQRGCFKTIDFQMVKTTLYGSLDGGPLKEKSKQTVTYQVRNEK